MSVASELNSKNSSCCGIKSFIRSGIKKVFRKTKSSDSEKQQKSEKNIKESGSGATSRDDYDYVKEDGVSSDIESISLYKCEMPEEKIRKLRQQRDSMSRLKDLPLGVKSPYPSVDKSKPKFVDYEPISKRPILLSAEVFARNRAAKGNMDKMSTSLDYLDMEDPPNFDDFMYLRWEENTPPSSKGTPPPPYSILGSSLSNQNYIKMLGREKLKTRLWA